MVGPVVEMRQTLRVVIARDLFTSTSLSEKTRHWESKMSCLRTQCDSPVWESNKSNALTTRPPRLCPYLTAITLSGSHSIKCYYRILKFSFSYRNGGHSVTTTKAKWTNSTLELFSGNIGGNYYCLNCSQNWPKREISLWKHFLQLIIGNVSRVDDVQLSLTSNRTLSIFLGPLSIRKFNPT